MARKQKPNTIRGVPSVAAPRPPRPPKAKPVKAPIGGYRQPKRKKPKKLRMPVPTVGTSVLPPKPRKPLTRPVRPPTGTPPVARPRPLPRPKPAKTRRRSR